MGSCSKPGCSGNGAAVLTYDYADRRATIADPPRDHVSPHLYVLCVMCADRLTAPLGWLLEDLRSESPLFLPA